MNAKTTIEKNWRDYTMHSCTVAVPQSFGRPEKVIEIRRSMLNDCAFMIVVNDIPKEVVPQCEIWRTIKEISMELFKAFGIFKPLIGWQKMDGDFQYSVDDEGNFVKTEE